MPRCCVIMRSITGQGQRKGAGEVKGRAISLKNGYEVVVHALVRKIPSFFLITLHACIAFPRSVTHATSLLQHKKPGSVLLWSLQSVGHTSTSCSATLNVGLTN
jgi:hypothetical protein